MKTRALLPLSVCRNIAVYGGQEELVMGRDIKDIVQRAIGDSLTERQAHVITRYYGLDGLAPETMPEIAERLWLSVEMVRRHFLNALMNLCRDVEIQNLRKRMG